MRRARIALLLLAGIVAVALLLSRTTNVQAGTRIGAPPGLMFQNGVTVHIKNCAVDSGDKGIHVADVVMFHVDDDSQVGISFVEPNLMQQGGKVQFVDKNQDAKFQLTNPPKPPAAKHYYYVWHNADDCTNLLNVPQSLVKSKGKPNVRKGKINSTGDPNDITVP